MKKITSVLIVTLLFAVTSSFAQNAAKNDNVKPAKAVKENGPVASFDKTTYDFPDIVQGTPSNASFVLTNDGNEPLIISSATASCGCTNLSWTREPILPGKSTTISVTYNAAAPGTFIKTMSVVTNASKDPVVLQIKGKVVPKG